MECAHFIYLREMEQFISAKEWDRLELLSPTETCPSCTIHRIRESIAVKLMRILSYTDEVKPAFERLYGPVTPQKLIEMISSSEGIRFYEQDDIQMLIPLIEKYDLDVNSGDYIFGTMLMDAIHGINVVDAVDVVSIIRFLLSRGANINLLEPVYGKTVLHKYVVECIRLIYIESESRIEAIHGDMERGIRTLLEWGADPLLGNKEGISALDIARKRYQRILVIPTNRTGKKSNVLQHLIHIMEEYA